jgi:hypothetical protein
MVWWCVYYCGMSKPSDQQPEREELARHAAVEATHAPDVSPGNNEEDMHPEDTPATHDVGPSSRVTMPLPPQTPAVERGKSCFNPGASCTLRN